MGEDVSLRFQSVAFGEDASAVSADFRGSCSELAEKIYSVLPQSRETSLALTKLEECLMWINKSIASSERDK